MMVELLCEECFMDKQRRKSREQSVLLSESKDVYIFVRGEKSSIEYSRKITHP